MEKYVLLTRNNTGMFLDKVTIVADLEFCREVLQAMMYANKNANRAEIIEGDRDYIGDFRVKPIRKFYINMHRTLIMDGEHENN
jgi:hypothetical protein